MEKKRTPIGKFIHSKWSALNIRAGKYRHLQTKNKCKAYNNITVEFTQKEFKEWCLKKEQQILSLVRPSIDRIDSSKNYSLDNIQVIELTENIKKKKQGSTYLNGPLSNTIRGVRFKDNRYVARITINTKETYLGSFKTEIEALEVFKVAYRQHYGKDPWDKDAEKASKKW